LLTGRSNLIMIGELSRLTAKAARRRADELLGQFDLTDAAGRAVKTYSGGMRRRLDLAASLIGHPAVLFLDEPTTGLDPSARALMWDIVRQLVADGTTLLLTTQYLDEADQLANRIAVIDGGKVIAEGTPGELKASMGGQRLLITLAEGSDASAAAAALRPFTTASIIPNEGSRLIEAPVTATDGLATEVVRALDAAGVKVNDIAVRSASLDDVFRTLTGHKAEDKAEENEKQEVPA
jgi:ABC-2 type transport system ATP-binding protein